MTESSGVGLVDAAVFDAIVEAFVEIFPAALAGVAECQVDNVIAALTAAGFVVVKKRELQHRTSAENCKEGWIYGTPISSGHVCQLCEAEK